MILSLGAAMGFTSCDDLFEPAQENLKDVDQMYVEVRTGFPCERVS